MIRELTDAIAAALSAEFGDGYAVYVNNVEQGLLEPCFFVSCVRSSARPFLDKRRFWENLFCVQYFPKDKNREKEEDGEVSERLFACLETVDLADGPMRGTQLSCEITDGILSFFVHYDLFTVTVDDTKDTMLVLTQNTEYR